MAVQREYAQELLDAVRQCCQVWSFSPRSEEFRASSGEFSSSLGNFSSSSNIQSLIILMEFSNATPGSSGGMTT